MPHALVLTDLETKAIIGGKSIPIFVTERRPLTRAMASITLKEKNMLEHYYSAGASGTHNAIPF